MHAPRERVWQLLLDPEALLACVPGCESVERVSETVFRACFKVKVSYITFSAATETTITKLEPPSRLESVTRGEDASLASGFTSDLVAAIDQAVADGVDVNEDIFASAEYRRHLASVFTKRAVKTALERAR